MQLLKEEIVYSASDLVAYIGCKYRTTLDLRKLAGWEQRRTEVDAASKLVQEYGNRHELAYLNQLKQNGLHIVEIDKSASVEAQLAATRNAMKEGVDVIFQATLFQKPFLGYADFLLRKEGKSKFGDYHYEVADTKLAKSNKAKFVVQLCLYADLLAAEQGRLPEYLHVILGTLDAAGRERRGLTEGDENVVKLRTMNYIHYVRNICSGFLAYTSEKEMAFPRPVAGCKQCGWREHCENHWKEIDHLSLVANTSTSQIAKLEHASVPTMHALARFEGEISNMGRDVLSKLKRQSALQCSPTDEQGRLRYEFLPQSQIKITGFGLLPESSVGDLYFDMEGFPHEIGGLEYLFGVGYFEWGDTARWTFKPFWAHNRAQEKQAFEDFMDFVECRLNEFPDAHIYHYAPYERTAIKNLSSLHNTRASLRDRILREGRLVDLYMVVKSGLLLALPSYSIKKVEAYYRGERHGEVANAGDSIVQYEAYRVADDPQLKRKLLGDIESYNRDDVESTQQLHVWLEGLRPAETQRPPVKLENDEKESNTLNEREARETIAKDALAKWVESQPGSDQPAAAHLAGILGELLGFYWRCQLPTFWRIYERENAEEYELLDDKECLALLTSTGKTWQEGKSVYYEYNVPPQESMLYSGAGAACLTDGEPVSNFKWDQEGGLVTFSRGKNRQVPPEVLTIFANEIIPTDNKLDAIFRFVYNLCSNKTEPSALLGLLGRKLPAINGVTSGDAIVSDYSLNSIVQAIERMNGSHLVIQGPPGTGKTTTASKVIAALLAKGKRVGITSNSHSAINNLMKAAWNRVGETGAIVTAVVAKRDDGLPAGIRVIESKFLDSSKHNLAGGTTWMFCRPAQHHKWDYLFVDEASQVSLADVVAAGQCAHNIVLLGDQMQLPQPIQGIHPGDSGLSALDYLMQDRATVPPENGLFLGETYRMHSDVCHVISEGIYDGRLVSAAPCDRQRLVLNADADCAIKPTGIIWVPLSHKNNSQSSIEEANRIKAMYDSLRQQSWINKNGVSAQLTAEDILVVAPYNAQVRLLQKVLGANARIGTVDKFQGQEAAVAILSMTSSDAENMPRGVDFLFSKNRLNVAVSRAKCLAVIVASPSLKNADCGKIEDIPLLNFYSMLTSVPV